MNNFMKKKDKVLVLAYVGTGKTEMAKRYERVFNPSSDDYRYIFDKELPLEQRKSNPNRIENPDFPNNFIKVVSEGLKKNIVLLALTQKLFSLYQSKEFQDKVQNARIILACPSKESFSEYEKMYRARGNSETFIENRRKEFPFIMDMFENAQGYEKVIVQQSGQYKYLDGALAKHGIKLQQKNKES
jgi:hypothetical protein